MGRDGVSEGQKGDGFQMKEKEREANREECRGGNGKGDGSVSWG